VKKTEVVEVTVEGDVYGVHSRNSAVKVLERVSMSVMFSQGQQTGGAGETNVMLGGNYRSRYIIY
jgi:uncharacterized lipoprotein YajG